jgi:hypothetical protein
MKTENQDLFQGNLPDPLKHPYRVWQYLRQLGYSCSKSQPRRDIKSSKLSPIARGGGFSKESVRRYAVECKLSRQVFWARPGSENHGVSSFDNFGSDTIKGENMSREFNLTEAKAKALKSEIWMMDEAESADAREVHLAAAVAILDSVTMDISAMHDRILELERGRADKK